MKFLFYGPFILLASVPADTYVFYYNLFTAPPKEHEVTNYYMTLESLEIFKSCLDEAIHQKRIAKGGGGNSVDFAELNVLVQDRLQIFQCIASMLFLNLEGTKFVRDPETGKLELDD